MDHVVTSQGVRNKDWDVRHIATSKTFLIPRMCSAVSSNLIIIRKVVNLHT